MSTWTDDQQTLDLLQDEGLLDADAASAVRTALETNPEITFWDALGTLDDPGAARERAEQLQTPVNSALGQPVEGRYVDGDELGAGGMGRVFLAEDRHLGRTVAIKELHDPRGSPRFLREARITAQLEHPGILPVYELGTGGQGPYYAMQRIRGRTLTEVMAEREPSELLQHFVDVCQAMGFAHSRGVVHRDLKPDNVMVGPFGETLVIDWGIAKPTGAVDDAVEQIEADAPTLTRMGSVMGTPAYMAPEVARGGAARADPRADVWSLGVMLYELLAGRRAYGGQTSLEVLEAVKSGPPQDIASAAPSAPPELAAIVRKALSWDPRDRYPTAKELADELEAFRTGAVVSAYDYSLGERLGRWLSASWYLWLPVVVGLVVLVVASAVATSRLTAQRDAADRAAFLAASRAAEASGDPAAALVLARAGGDPELERLQTAVVGMAIPTPAAFRPDGSVVSLEGGKAWIIEDGERRRAPEADGAIDVYAAAGGVALQYLDHWTWWAPDGHLIELRRSEAEGFRGDWGDVFALSDGHGIEFYRAGSNRSFWDITQGPNEPLVDRSEDGRIAISFSVYATWIHEVNAPPIELGHVLDRRPHKTSAAPLWLDADTILRPTQKGLDRWSVDQRERVGNYPVGDVRGLALSPDHSAVAVQTATGRLRVVSLEEGAVAFDHPAEAASRDWQTLPIVYSPDGHWIAARSATNEALVVDAQAGGVVAHLPLPGAVQRLDWAPDGSQLLVQGPGVARLFDAESWSARRSFHMNLPLYAVPVVAAKDDALVFALARFGVMVWDADGLELVPYPKGGPTTPCGISATDPPRIVLGDACIRTDLKSSGGTEAEGISVVEVRDPLRLVERRKTGVNPWGPIMTADGSVASIENRCVVWNGERTCPERWPGRLYASRSTVAAAASNAITLVGSDSIRLPEDVERWTTAGQRFVGAGRTLLFTLDAATGELATEPVPGRVTALAGSASHIVVGTADGDVFVDGERVHRRNAPILSLATSGDRLAVGTADRRIVVLRDGRVIRDYRANGIPERLTWLDDRLAATGPDAFLDVWPWKPTARTNLRVCPGTQRVVPVFPFPDPGSVFAPPEACR